MRSGVVNCVSIYAELREGAKWEIIAERVVDCLSLYAELREGAK